MEECFLKWNSISDWGKDSWQTMQGGVENWSSTNGSSIGWLQCSHTFKIPRTAHDDFWLKRSILGQSKAELIVGPFLASKDLLMLACCPIVLRSPEEWLSLRPSFLYLLDSAKFLKRFGMKNFFWRMAPPLWLFIWDSGKLTDGVWSTWSFLTITKSSICEGPSAKTSSEMNLDTSFQYF